MHLDLSHCIIGDEGALALGATLLELPNLRILILTNNRIGGRGAKGLAYALAVQSSHDLVPKADLSKTSTEARLHVSNKWLTGSGLRVSPPPRYGLHERTTSGVSLWTAQTLKGCSTMSAHSGLTRTLDVLDLSLNPIGDLGGMFLAAAISRGGGPAIIDMVGCGLGNEAGLHLAESLRFTQLVQAMNLSCNPLSEAAGFAFVEVRW